ncbi:MAG: xanthine dehydrogenase accessory protein XdhC [Pseudomonadota bacterium]
MRIWGTIAEILADDRTCVLVSVLKAQGSAPREAGARMIVRDDGNFYGTIGGGSLEWEAIAFARSVLEGNGAAFETRTMALGPDLGQCCGGRVVLGFEPLGSADLSAVLALADAERLTGFFATRGAIGTDGRIRRTIEPPDRASADAEFARLEGAVLIEQFGIDRRPVFLFGAGHVARALVLALAPLPFAVTWIDNRADAFPSHVPTNTRPCRVADLVAELPKAGPGTFVLVMTHDHALDQTLVEAALGADRFPYVGLIGSRTKRARFIRRLKMAGLPDEALDRMVCPIGIGGIASKAPAAIAASVAAQLLSVDEAERVSAEPAVDRHPVGVD